MRVGSLKMLWNALICFQAAFGVGFSPPFGAEPLPPRLAFQAA